MKKANLFLNFVIIILLNSSPILSQEMANNLANVAVDLILTEKASLYTIQEEKIKKVSFDEAQGKLRVEIKEPMSNRPNFLKRNGKVYLCDEAIHLSKEVFQSKIYLSVEVKGNYSRDGIPFLVALIKMSDLSKVVEKQLYEEFEKISLLTIEKN
jgi:hypothetical protein